MTPKERAEHAWAEIVRRVSGPAVMFSTCIEAAITAALADEREACAQIVDAAVDDTKDWHLIQQIARRIRARGKE